MPAPASPCFTIRSSSRSRPGRAGHDGTLGQGTTFARQAARNAASGRMLRPGGRQSAHRLPNQGRHWPKQASPALHPQWPHRTRRKTPPSVWRRRKQPHRMLAMQARHRHELAQNTAPLQAARPGIPARNGHHQLVTRCHADPPHARPRRSTPAGNKSSEATNRHPAAIQVRQCVSHPDCRTTEKVPSAFLRRTAPVAGARHLLPTIV